MGCTILKHRINYQCLQGVSALPRMSIYRAPSTLNSEPFSDANPPRPCAVLDTPFSKIKNLKQVGSYLYFPSPNNTFAQHDGHLFKPVIQS